jgi:protein-tyrosine-phosphatase
MMPAVLFVCTANICRSPMTAGIFNKILKEENPEGEWRVESAGTWGLDGEPAAAGSLAVMKNNGIDISEHRARSVSKDLLQVFDLILTMESGQKESMRVEFPEVSDRIFLLSEMVNQKQDVDDPYGGVFSEYEQAADEIEEYLMGGYDTIVHRATHSNRDG